MNRPYFIPAALIAILPLLDACVDPPDLAEVPPADDGGEEADAGDGDGDGDGDGSAGDGDV